MNSTFKLCMQYLSYYSTAHYIHYYIHLTAFFSSTTWVNRHQKGNLFWILMKQEMMECQWYQLDHMQLICSSLQTVKHTTISPLNFWPTVLSVEPLVHCLVCLSSVTFCIVVKRHVLAKNCLKKWIGNQGQKVDFWGRRHISTSGFAATATETAVFALFLPVQPSNR